MSLPTLILKPGRERSLLRRHPWIFSSAIARRQGKLHSGTSVTIRDEQGKFIAKGAWSPKSKIAARIWSFNEDETIDDAFFKRRIATAIEKRQLLLQMDKQQGVRLIHAESDGLPGVVVDRYKNTLVIQLNTAGADRWRQAIINALQQATDCKRIYERSDSESRQLEGLEPINGWCSGETPDKAVQIKENGIRYLIDIEHGHKTGFYLDQRDNRRLLRKMIEGMVKNGTGTRVLNCFCYTGGFSMQALAGGAESVLSIDSSAAALQTAKENLELNRDLPADRAEWLQDDVFKALREMRERGDRFDYIILDPPKFAPTVAHADKAARAYKDINLLAMQLLNPGGLLMSYSCSSGISSELFQKILAGAALDAECQMQIIRYLHSGSDHPTLLSFPEGAYLKGLLLQRQ